MDKLKMQSENLVNENVEKIAKLFPNCVTEGKDENGQVTKLVDFDLLKQELSKVVVDGNDERYTLNWAGKKQSILTANSPINATLRPCKEESVGKDGTNGGFDSENLYIEGDNLDVLKLLRETYLNKIKMIYIDPPYNTGNDFVYNDDFASSADEYLQNSKSYDEEGNRMVQNLESNGRFHSDWLSMMYPRLKLARDLLTDDGGILVSIDDNEMANLRKICNEILGESNFICSFIWQKSFAPKNDNKYISNSHEYIVLYAKNKGLYKRNLLPRTNTDGYNNPDNDPRGVWTSGTALAISFSPNAVYPLTAPNGKVHFPPEGRCWRYSKETFDSLIADNRMWFGKDGNGVPRVKRFLSEMPEGIVPQSLLKYEEVGSGQDGTQGLKEIFDNTLIFDFPKPIKLLKRLLTICSDKNSYVLDFFSGSATTAHAVMELNAEDGGNRKFIMVQLPEHCEEKSVQFKSGYKNICEIGKERIRRAGKKILEEKAHKDTKEKTDPLIQTLFDKNLSRDEKELNAQKAQNILDDKIKNNNLDIGFRVLKLDSSNMKDVYYTPSETSQANLFDMVSNIKEDRSPEDLLFQVMLDMGVMLSSEIKTLDIKGKKVFNVNDGNLVCCFDENLTDEVVTEIAKLEPLYAVFRDSSMSSDTVAVNFDQIFATYSPNTTRKVL